MRCVWFDPDASFLQAIPRDPIATVPFWFTIGLPGSGKSTLAQRWQQLGNRQVISTDQIRAHLFGDEAVQGNWLQVWQQVADQLQQAAQGIQQGQLQSVLLDATHAPRQQRRQTIALARRCGFNHITAIWLNLPLGLCWQRNQTRDRQVPKPIMMQMHRQLKGRPPSLQEDVDRLIIVTLG